MKKKVISFSLFKAPESWEQAMETNHQKYITGIKNNLELISKFYPDWFVYLYHDGCFSEELVKQFSEYKNLVPILAKDFGISAMQWRFLPHDDEEVELFISRDLDCRITEREAVSVHEWIESGKSLHVMRDHPHHNYFILGGMWGMRRIPEFNMMESIKQWNFSKNYNNENNWFDKWWDMHFLDDVIWIKFHKSIYENASFWCKTEECKPFTIEWNDRHFVGEIYLATGERWFHYTLI
jgi:hypothetical protein